MTDKPKPKRIPSDVEALTKAVSGALETIGKQGRLIRDLQSQYDQSEKNYQETNNRLSLALQRIHTLETKGKAE